jgi:hypothetical protein
VSSDLRTTDELQLPVSTHRRRGWFLVAVMAFQLWLWGTRIWNLLSDTGDVTAAFVAVHTVLYVAAIGVGLAVGALGVRLLLEARQAEGR